MQTKIKKYFAQGGWNQGGWSQGEYKGGGKGSDGKGGMYGFENGDENHSGVDVKSVLCSLAVKKKSATANKFEALEEEERDLLIPNSEDYVGFPSLVQEIAKTKVTTHCSVAIWLKFF